MLPLNPIKMRLMLLIIFFPLSAALAQTKGGNISIDDVARGKDRVHMKVTVSFNTSKGDDQAFLIFMIATPSSDQLRVAEFQSADDTFVKFEKADESPLEFAVDLNSRNWNGPAIIYPILVQGPPESFLRVLSVIDGEFDTINQVLNVIGKSRCKPLTYAEHPL